MAKRPLRRTSHASSNSCFLLAIAGPGFDFVCVSLGQGTYPFVRAPEILGIVFRLEGVEMGFVVFSKVHANINTVKPADGRHQAATRSADNLAGSDGGYQP